MEGKKVIISESMADRLVVEGIIAESNMDDLLRSNALEKKIKSTVKDAIKDDKQTEKELEKKVRAIVAKSVNTLFRTLWMRKNFFEDSIKNDQY